MSRLVQPLSMTGFHSRNWLTVISKLSAMIAQYCPDATVCHRVQPAALPGAAFVGLGTDVVVEPVVEAIPDTVLVELVSSNLKSV